MGDRKQPSVTPTAPPAITQEKGASSLVPSPQTLTTLGETMSAGNQYEEPQDFFDFLPEHW